MLVIGVAGTELNAQERDWLQHDACAGVILFTRNFASRAQVAELSQAIREAAPTPAAGLCRPGRRARAAFSRRLQRLAAVGSLRCDVCAATATAPWRCAREHAWLMASEVRASGVDLSFAPVVDLGRGNRAIGDRAFSADPEVVAAFTRAYVEGMHAAGMPATLKHFPGHGSVLEDTHFDAAVDDRTLDAMRALDLVPFVAGIEAGADAVMMAHVVYPTGRAGTGRLFAALDQGHPARRDGIPRRGVLRRHRHGRGVLRRRRQGAHRRAPGCGLRRGAGLPSRAGGRIAGCRRRARRSIPRR